MYKDVMDLMKRNLLKIAKTWRFKMGFLIGAFDSKPKYVLRYKDATRRVGEVQWVQWLIPG
jgi:hypothetical protein